MEGLTVKDFDIVEITCPKCGKPAKVYMLKATDDNFLICRWPECSVGTMEGNYNCIWKSLTIEEKEKVRRFRKDCNK